MRATQADALRAEFRDTGVVRLEGAFGNAEAGAIRDTVWRHVERHTDVRLADPGTWTNPLQLSFKSLKGKAVFAPLIGNPAVHGALDAIFGPGEWLPPKQRRAQILLTMPSAGPWVMPTAWHMDAGFDRPTWPVPGVKLFSFFDEVEPEGGGTLLLAGGHRLVERYARTLPPGTGGNMATWGRFLRQDPWLDRLRRGGSVEEPRRDMLDATHEVDGIAIRPMELTGRPGDVFITHVHVFHCIAPNVGPKPRQMLGAFIHR